MSTIVFYGLVAFAVIFGGGLLGMLLGRLMPVAYRDKETQAIVQTAAGMVSISTALVLGLLVASAKGKFDVSNRQMEELAASLMLMDRNLMNCGPEAKDIIMLLRSYTVANIATAWPDEPEAQSATGGQPAWQIIESIQQRLRELTPKTDAQRASAASASQTALDLAKAGWLETAQQANHAPQPFILLLIAWLFVLFLSFGLYAPHNGLVVAALFVCALSIACAIAMVVDLDYPFEGVIVVSPQSMQKALATIHAAS